MNRAFTILAGFFLVWLSSCAIPVQNGTGAQGVQLTLVLTQPSLTASEASARLLLSDAKTLSVIGSVAGKQAFTKTVPVAGQKVTVVLPLELGVTYTLTARAVNATGDLVYAGETTVTLTSALTGVLYLLPVQPSGALWTNTFKADDQPVGSGSGTFSKLDPGKTVTFLVDFGAAGTSFQFQTLPAGVSAYLQTLDGQPLALDASRVLSAGALGANRQFWVTYQYDANASGQATLTPLGTFTIPAQSLTLGFPSYLATSTKVTVSWPPTFLPANATDRAITDYDWTSSDPVITVDGTTGDLTAGASGGSAVISVRSKLTGQVVASATIPVITPPNVTLNAIPSYVNALPLAVSGSADGGVGGSIDFVYYLVDVAGNDHSTDDPSSWSTATLAGATGDQTRSWTQSLTVASEGTWTLWVQAKDALGRVSKLAASRTFTYDTTAPALTYSAPATYLIDDVLDLSGTAADSGSGVQSVDYNLDSLGWNSATGTTSWTISLASLTEGSHTLQIRSTDKALNTSTASSVSFTVDTVVPSVTFTPPVSYQTANSLTVSVTAADSGSGVQSVDYNLDSLGWNAAAGATPWTISLASLTEGPHTLQIRSSDVAGNTSTVSSASFTVDTVDPVLTVTAPAAGSTINDTKITLSGTASDASGILSVQYSLDSGTTWTLASGTTTWSAVLSGLANGTYQFEVKATDAAGRTTISPKRTVTVDNSVNLTFAIAGYQSLVFSPSAVTIVKGSQPSITTSNTSLTSSGTNWEWWIDNVSAGTGSSFTLPAGLAVGVHTISAFVTYAGVDYSGTLTVTVTP